MSAKDRLYSEDQIVAMSDADLRAKERQVVVLEKAAARSKMDLRRERKRRNRQAVAAKVRA